MVRKKNENATKHILRIMVEKPRELVRSALVIASDTIEVPQEMYRRVRDLDLE